MSSIESPDPPPDAASELLDATDEIIFLNKPLFKLGLLIGVKESTSLIVLDCTLDSKPPPIIYVTVNIVFEGACPYVLVNKKLEGS